MFEWIDTNPAPEVQEAEYSRLLGYPKNHTLDGRARELADAARAWYAENGRPWIYAREINAVELGNGALSLERQQFASRRLHDFFASASAHAAVVVAVSAGIECEESACQLWRVSKPDEYFFLEMFGSAVVEQLIALASGRICAWGDQRQMAVLPPFSPGHSGWNVADQTKLWRVIREGCAGGFPGELTVLDTGMLRPKKSQLALFGVTQEVEKARRFARLIPCENCSLPACQYRRAPAQAGEIRRQMGGGIAK